MGAFPPADRMLARPLTRSLCTRLALGALLCALVACGDTPASTSSSSSQRLAPGDSLLDGRHALRVTGMPESNMPDAIAEGLRAVLAEPRVELPPEAWVEGELAPRSWAYLILGGKDATGNRDARRWMLRPPFAPDLSLGALQFTHEGRSLRSSTERVGSREFLLWFDTTAVCVFWWDEQRQVLVALSEKRPREVSMSYAGRSTLDLDLQRWEPRLSDVTVPAREFADLQGRVTFGLVEKRALLAPAPSTLSVTLDELAVDELQLGASVLDLGYDVHDGLPKRAPRAGDGVTFAVDIEVAGERTRVWQQHVQPRPRFREARVDLRPWVGQAVTLHLVTEPGPEGNQLYDYALWSDLRFWGEPARAPELPHVVFIDVDTLRADRLGMYGYERATSPRLDAWAAEQAVVYRDAISVNNWTLPSTSSMLTGLAVHQHGVVQYPRTLTDAHEPLAMRLSELGYETYARTDGGWLIPPFGFSRGFDVFDHGQKGAVEHQQIGWSRELQRLRERRSERPVFYFLQTYQVHQPLQDDRRFEDPGARYNGPLAAEPLLTNHVNSLVNSERGLLPEDVRYLNDIYDAGIRRMDDVVADLLDALPEVFGDEPYMVVLNSDHGEELGERGTTGHGQSLHSEQIRVPLVIRHPDGRGPGRVEQPVSALDIVPTILDYVGQRVPDHLPGRSLRKPPPRDRLRVAQHMDSAHAALLQGLKLVSGELPHDGIEHFELPDLFDHAEDPEERVDLSEIERARVEQLGAALADWLKSHPVVGDGSAASDVAESVIADLEALGYVGMR
ncbi:MAG: hypothetical protein DHS20C15_25030 [Planctomycetota bacterium]|nr:MAG: hypothetical protein DHS20C15_25030 [Planctomycetota bacterium]